jgi:hypothetical protein
MNPSSPHTDLEASAVKGGIVVRPTIAMTMIIVVAIEKTFAALTTVLFFLSVVRLCTYNVSHSAPSTNAMDKRIPLIEELEAKIKTKIG